MVPLPAGLQAKDLCALDRRYLDHPALLLHRVSSLGLGTCPTRPTIAADLDAAITRAMEPGVRAVIAIQAPMEAGLQNRFSDHFFTALLKTGAIDVAVTAARAKIHEPREWAWTYPVLTMRTRDAVLFQPLDSWMQEKIDQVALTNL